MSSYFQVYATFPISFDDVSSDNQPVLYVDDLTRLPSYSISPFKTDPMTPFFMQQGITSI